MTIYHKHHIIPRHMGGTDEPANLVILTVEEHAEAHRILYEKHGLIQDKLAWQGLTGMISKQDLIKELMSHNSSGKSNPMYGRSAITEQNLKWYTDGTKTIYVPEGTAPDNFYPGRKLGNRISPSEETKRKISAANTGKIPPNRLCVISPTGEKYESIKSAALSLGLTVSQFRHRCLQNGDWFIQR